MLLIFGFRPKSGAPVKTWAFTLGCSSISFEMIAKQGSSGFLTQNKISNGIMLWRLKKEWRFVSSSGSRPRIGLMMLMPGYQALGKTLRLFQRKILYVARQQTDVVQRENRISIIWTFLHEIRFSSSPYENSMLDFACTARHEYKISTVIFIFKISFNDLRVFFARNLGSPAWPPAR